MWLTLYYSLFLLVGLYVLLSSTGWMASAARFALGRENREADSFYEIPDEELPSMTVLVPAYSEEATIGACLDALREVDYLGTVAVVSSLNGSSRALSSNCLGRPFRYRHGGFFGLRIL